MGDHTVESLRAEVESWLWNDPIGRQVAENAIDAMEAAERERDALRTEVSEALESARRVVRERDEARADLTVFTSRPDCSAPLLGLMRERDEAREGLAACEASKADEERANAGLAKEYASMQQRWLDQRSVSVNLRYRVEVYELEVASLHRERDEARAEVERLRAALREIANVVTPGACGQDDLRPDECCEACHAREIARRALGDE